jgi:hypothetical protein
MALPIPFDYIPMNARLVDAIPSSARRGDLTFPRIRSVVPR